MAGKTQLAAQSNDWKVRLGTALMSVGQKFRPTAFLFAIFITGIIGWLIHSVVAGAIGSQVFGAAQGAVVMTAGLIVVGGCIGHLAVGLTKLTTDEPPPSVPTKTHMATMRLWSLFFDSAGPRIEECKEETGLVRIVSRIRVTALMLGGMMVYITYIIITQMLTGPAVASVLTSREAAVAAITAALLIVGTGIAAIGNSLVRLSEDPAPSKVPQDVHLAMLDVIAYYSGADEIPAGIKKSGPAWTREIPDELQTEVAIEKGRAMIEEGEAILAEADAAIEVSAADAPDEA